MVAILKTFACVAALAAGLATTASAEYVWAKWADTVRGEIKQVQAGTEKLKEARDNTRCPQQTTSERQVACVGALNTIIELMGVKQTQLEIKLLAIPLPAAQRDAIIKKAADSFDAINKQTVVLADQADQQFPVPH